MRNSAEGDEGFFSGRVFSFVGFKSLMYGCFGFNVPVVLREREVADVGGEWHGKIRK